MPNNICRFRSHGQGTSNKFNYTFWGHFYMAAKSYFYPKWAFKVWTEAKIDYLKTFILMEPYAHRIIYGLKKLDNG